MVGINSARERYSQIFRNNCSLVRIILIPVNWYKQNIWTTFPKIKAYTGNLIYADTYVV